MKRLTIALMTLTLISSLYSCGSTTDTKEESKATEKEIVTTVENENNTDDVEKDTN